MLDFAGHRFIGGFGVFYYCFFYNPLKIQKVFHTAKPGRTKTDGVFATPQGEGLLCLSRLPIGAHRRWPWGTAPSSGLHWGLGALSS